ncbi:hypothetical protein BSKO_01097 [Bryopsis sp. KO-2023]|nr:hypothetical protein BSKO_01097 [Bryopsis sp. KO-2023]
MAGGSAEEAILSICRQYTEGVTDGALEKELEGQMSPQDRATTINALLTSGRLQLFSSNGGLVYKEINQEEALRFRGLSSEDLLAYQVIEQAGNAGIWTKDMKQLTNLPQIKLNKILKNLEGRKLVKTFRPVECKTRKMYILYTLQPAEHLTGGAWYTNAEKDTEFIETLRQVCSRIIARDKLASLSEIAEIIRTKGYSRVALRDGDIKAVIDTLVYDGTVDEVEDDDEGVSYRPALLGKPDASPFTSFPCGVCPVFNECKPGGTVSPENCVYFDKWLDF